MASGVVWDDDAPPASGVVWDAAPREKVGLWEAGAKGAGQGITGGFGDEINGAVQALGARFLPESMGGGGEQAKKKGLLDLYRQNRDTFRQEDATAEQDQGAAYGVGNVVGGAALTPLIPGGSANSLRGLLMAGGGLGAATGLGTSKADMTRGELGRAAFDTAVGGAVGAGAGLLGHGIQKGISGAGKWLGKKGAERLAAAETKAVQMADEAESAIEGTLRSEAGRSATAAYKQARNVIDAGIDPATLSGAEREAFDDLVAELGQSGRKGLVSGLSEKRAAAATFSEALETAAERRASKAAELLKPSIGADVQSLAKAYGEPLVANAVGGPAVGMLLGRTRAGKAIATRLMRPGNQKALAELLSRAGAGVSHLAPGGAKLQALAGTGRGAIPGVQSGLMDVPALASLFEREDDPGSLVAALRKRRGR